MRQRLGYATDHAPCGPTADSRGTVTSNAAGQAATSAAQTNLRMFTTRELTADPLQHDVQLGDLAEAWASTDGYNGPIRRPLDFQHPLDQHLHLGPDRFRTVEIWMLELRSAGHRSAALLRCGSRSPRRLGVAYRRLGGLAAGRGRQNGDFLATDLEDQTVDGEVLPLRGLPVERDLDQRSSTAGSTEVFLPTLPVSLTGVVLPKRRRSETSTVPVLSVHSTWSVSTDASSLNVPRR